MPQLLPCKNSAVVLRCLERNDEVRCEVLIGDKSQALWKPYGRLQAGETCTV